MLFIDSLSRRPLNSEPFFSNCFFFREMFVTRRFAKVYYFLLSTKSRIFFLFYNETPYRFLPRNLFLIFIDCAWFIAYFKWNLKKDTPIWRRAFSFQILITKDIMLTTTETATARSSWDFIHAPSEDINRSGVWFLLIFSTFSVCKV